MNAPQSPDEQVDALVRNLLTSGRASDAVELATKHFGARITLRVMAIVKKPDALMDTMQELWMKVLEKGPLVVWDRSFIGWLHIVARNQALEAVSRGHAKPNRAIPLSDIVVSEIAENVRSTIVHYLTPKVVSGMQALRATLKPEDQELLRLRADQELSFNDVARIMADPEELDAKALKAEVDRLTKRFQRLKTRLADLAREAGLVD